MKIEDLLVKKVFESVPENAKPFIQFYDFLTPDNISFIDLNDKKNSLFKALQKARVKKYEYDDVLNSDTFSYTIKPYVSEYTIHFNNLGCDIAISFKAENLSYNPKEGIRGGKVSIEIIPDKKTETFFTIGYNLRSEDYKTIRMVYNNLYYYDKNNDYFLLYGDESLPYMKTLFEYMTENNFNKTEIIDFTLLNYDIDLSKSKEFSGVVETVLLLKNIINTEPNQRNDKKINKALNQFKNIFKLT